MNKAKQQQRKYYIRENDLLFQDSFQLHNRFCFPALAIKTFISCPIYSKVNYRIPYKCKMKLLFTFLNYTSLTLGKPRGSQCNVERKWEQEFFSSVLLKEILLLYQNTKHIAAIDSAIKDSFQLTQLFYVCITKFSQMERTLVHLKYAGKAEQAFSLLVGS